MDVKSGRVGEENTGLENSQAELPVRLLPEALARLSSARSLLAETQNRFFL